MRAKPGNEALGAIGGGFGGALGGYGGASAGRVGGGVIAALAMKLLGLPLTHRGIRSGIDLGGTLGGIAGSQFGMRGGEGLASYFGDKKKSTKSSKE